MVLPKQTKGRQKIEIKPIQAKSNLQVTFSKRRSGLLKKASELSLLCGAHVAVLAFSPGNKLFSFAHPTLDAVLDRYLTQNCNAKAVQEGASTNEAQVQLWNSDYEDAVKELEEEKKRATVVKASAASGPMDGDFWWDGPIDEMGLEELEEYAKALKELKKKVTTRANELMMGYDGMGGLMLGPQDFSSTCGI